MLKPLIACAITASAAAAEPTFIPNTLDESIPIALISQDALMHHALAETLFQALPAAQQSLLAQAGAIGPITSTSAQGLGIRTHNHASTPRTIEQVEAQFGLTFSTAHRNMIERFQQQALRGEAVPALCLDPETDPKLAQALLIMLDSITAGGPERYRAVDRWTTTATDGGGIPQSKSITLTWSYVPDGTSADGAASSLFAWLDGIYAGNGGRTEWQLRISQTFARWGFLSGINYVLVADDGATVRDANPGILGTRGDVRLCAIPMDGNSGVLAYNYFPDRGDMFFDSGDSFYVNQTQNSRRLKNVTSHEHGHGMGLAHVEPVNQTKLMEPFVSTAYLGPRIDDRLGAQRNYGDAFEDNDSAAAAYNIGAIADGGSFSRSDLSTDDNSDIDYYQLSVPDAGDITVTLTLAAAAYEMGPQGGVNPPTIDYNNIHDLYIEIRDNSDSLVGTINNTGLGSDESGTVAVPSAGTYYVRVTPNNAINNIQLYNMTVAFALSVTPCPADINGDGFLDNGDINAFIALFLAGDPAADMNNDTFLDNGDINAYIALFLAGCP